MSTVVTRHVSGRPRRRASVAVAALAVLSLAGGLGTVATSAASRVRSTAGPGPVAEVVSPADLVTRTGTWIAHGRTLDLGEDGTGTAGVWAGAYDGTLVDLRLVPSRTSDLVAEVTGVRTRGVGGLAPSEVPGRGGLVTVSFGGDDVARVEWSAGHRRLSSDLCPSVGVDRTAMERLRCGA